MAADRAREIVGDDMLLMVDINGNYTVDLALESLRRIERYNIHWCEEPLPPTDVTGYGELRARSPVSLAAGASARRALADLECLVVLDAFATPTVEAADVVLLDLGLPRLDGRDVARRLRRLRGDSVLLIAVPGWGPEGDRGLTREAGFDHHLTKPVDHERLQALLARLPADEAAEER